jgi:hypothetical protein
MECPNSLFYLRSDNLNHTTTNTSGKSSVLDLAQYPNTNG